MGNPRKSPLQTGTMRGVDVAARLGVSRSTFYKWQAAGIGPKPAFRHGRCVRWAVESVEAYRAEGK